MKPEPETDFGPDDPVERLIESASRSSEWAEQRSLAGGGVCPAPQEIEDHVRGRLGDPQRKRRLARHIVSCPICLDRNLALMARLEVEETLTPTQPEPASIIAATPPRRSPRIVPSLAAAAALLLGATLVLGAFGDRYESPRGSALGGVFATDEHGFETRNGGGVSRPAIVPRRAVVTVERNGYLFLARLADGAPAVAAVEGESLGAVARSGEEILLPLDRALPCAVGETWLIAHGDRVPPRDELVEVLSRLAKGYVVEGFTAARIVPRPR